MERNEWRCKVVKLFGVTKDFRISILIEGEDYWDSGLSRVVL